MGHLSLINYKFLLNCKADPNISDEHEATPLITASSGGHKQIVQQLLEAKADPNACNHQGLTPMHAASSSCHLRVIELFIH